MMLCRGVVLGVVREIGKRWEEKSQRKVGDGGFSAEKEKKNLKISSVWEIRDRLGQKRKGLQWGLVCQ